MKNFDAIIEFVLNKMECKFVKKNKYYSCQNPISKSVGNPDKKWSAAWYRSTGDLRIFNADQINEKELVSIEEVCSYLHLEDDFFELTSDKLSIVEAIFSRNNMKLQKKEINSKSELIEEVSSKQQIEIEEYANTRKWIISNTVVFGKALFEYGNSKNYKKGIIFKYPCGFRKFREASFDKKFYMGDGLYKSFYEARKTKNNKTVLVVEGEGEAESIKQFVSCDVLAIHNFQTFPENLEQIQAYKKILILIDVDNFDKVYRKIFKLVNDNVEAEVRIRPKIFVIFKGKLNEDIDFNDLHRLDQLSKETIFSGYISEDVYKDKKGFEENYSVEDMRSGVEKSDLMKDAQVYEDFVLIR